MPHDGNAAGQIYYDEAWDDRDEPASPKTIRYIKILCEMTNFDPDKFNFATMTQTDASRIIDELLRRRGA